MKTEESVRRMREGRLYLPGDEAILRAQAKCLEALYAYNATQPSETARGKRCFGRCFAKSVRGALLSRLFMRILAAGMCILETMYMRILV